MRQLPHVRPRSLDRDALGGQQQALSLQVMERDGLIGPVQMGLLQRLARDDCGREGWLRTPVLTHQQIADMIGTSRETVTRALKGLRQAGWLEQDGKRYLVRHEQS